MKFRLALAALLGVLSLQAQTFFVQASGVGTLMPTANHHAYWSSPSDRIYVEEAASTAPWPAVQLGFQMPINRSFYAQAKLGLQGIRVAKEEFDEFHNYVNSSNYTLPILPLEVGFGWHMTSVFHLETNLAADVFGSATSWTSDIHWMTRSGSSLYAGFSYWSVEQHVESTYPANGWLQYGGHSAYFPMVSGHVGYRIALDFTPLRPETPSAIQTF